MERQTLCTRRTLRQVQTRLPATFQLTWAVLVICGCQAVAEDRGCNSDYITPDDTHALRDLIDNQALNSCNITFTFMTLPDRNQDDQHKACYVLGAATSVLDILKAQNKSYKPMSTNSNNVHKLLHLMDTLRTGQCFTRQNTMRCYRTFTRSPADMWTMVEDFFSHTKVLLPLKFSASDCVALYATCVEPAEDDIPIKEEATTPGPAECKCSCPTPGSTDSALASGKAIAASLEAIGSVNNQNGDQEESEHRVRIFVVVPCVLGILLSLCGLLYYRRQNQILRYELQQAVSRTEQREEGPLRRLRMDEMEIEMDEV